MQCHIVKSAWPALDYQYLANSAYKANRGLMDIYSDRVRFEF